MEEDNFRKTVEEMVKPLTGRLVDSFVEAKETIENSFPKEVPMEQRATMLNNIIQNQIQSLYKSFELIDFEKAKEEIEKIYSGKGASNEQQSKENQ